MKQSASPASLPPAPGATAAAALVQSGPVTGAAIAVDSANSDAAPNTQAPESTIAQAATNRTAALTLVGSGIHAPASGSAGGPPAPTAAPVAVAQPTPAAETAPPAPTPYEQALAEQRQQDDASNDGEPGPECSLLCCCLVVCCCHSICANVLDSPLLRLALFG